MTDSLVQGKYQVSWIQPLLKVQDQCFFDAKVSSLKERAPLRLEAGAASFKMCWIELTVSGCHILSS